MFCNILNVFTVTFDKRIALLTKSIKTILLTPNLYVFKNSLHAAEQMTILPFLLLLLLKNSISVYPGQTSAPILIWS